MRIRREEEEEEARLLQLRARQKKGCSQTAASLHRASRALPALINVSLEWKNNLFGGQRICYRQGCFRQQKGNKVAPCALRARPCDNRLPNLSHGSAAGNAFLWPALPTDAARPSITRYTARPYLCQVLTHHVRVPGNSHSQVVHEYLRAVRRRLPRESFFLQCKIAAF